MPYGIAEDRRTAASRRSGSVEAAALRSRPRRQPDRHGARLWRERSHHWPRAAGSPEGIRSSYPRSSPIRTRISTPRRYGSGLPARFIRACALLQTDFIDVMMIHSAPIEVIERGEALSVLQDLKQPGPHPRRGRERVRRGSRARRDRRWRLRLPADRLQRPRSPSGVPRASRPRIEATWDWSPGPSC